MSILGPGKHRLHATISVNSHGLSARITTVPVEGRCSEDTDHAARTEAPFDATLHVDQLDDAFHRLREALGAAERRTREYYTRLEAIIKSFCSEISALAAEEASRG